MRKIAFYIALTVLPIKVKAQEDWSKHLKLANNSAGYCERFYEIMNEHKDESNIAYGYYALATMMLAKVYKNPFTKLSYFNKGKALLEEIIQKDKANVELRFLRFAVQNEVPAILLYFNDMEVDKKMLDTYISESNTPLARRIMAYYSMKDIDYLVASGSAQ